MITITISGLIIFLLICILGISGYFHYKIHYKHLEDISGCHLTQQIVENNWKKEVESQRIKLQETIDSKDKEIENQRIKFQEVIDNLEKEFEKSLEEIEQLAISNKEKVDSAYLKELETSTKTIEFYESFILQLNTAIRLSDEKIKELDLRGVFESDDEIGFFFKGIKEIQNILNAFKVELLHRKDVDLK